MEVVHNIKGVSITIAYTPKEHLSFFTDAAPEARTYLLQHGEDLGDRMLQCFNAGCTDGSPTVIIGADSPNLPRHYIELAFDLLDEDASRIVFGPAIDGGFYLIGLSHPYPGLFREVKWSTPDVLDQCICNAAKLEIQSSMLPTWYDIDTPADLASLANELFQPSPQKERIPYHTAKFLIKLRQRGVI